MRKTDKDVFGGSLLLQNLTSVIVLFGFLLISGIWIGLSYKVDEERRLVLEAAKKETANFARAFEEHTLRTIRGTDQVVRFIKREYERLGRSIDIPQYVKEGMFAEQPFVLLGVIDEKGQFAVSNQVPFVPSDLKDREHFRIHIEKDTKALFISKPVLGRSSGKWSIQLTRRVNMPDGSFGGVVVIAVNPFYFTEFYKEVDLGKNSTVTIVGSDGFVRARQSGTESSLGQDLRNSVLMGRYKTHKDGDFVAVSPVDNRKRIYSYRSLPSYDLAVVVGVDEAEYFQALNKRINGYQVAAGFASVGIIGFTILLLYAFRRQRRDEKALMQTRDNLEVQVTERTKDLVVMNAELQLANLDLNTEVAERKRAEVQLQQRNAELGHAYAELKNVQTQVIQQEKMASIGQLAAGVAHEINNPLGFVMSNFELLQTYVRRLLQVIDASQELKASVLLEKEPGLLAKAAALTTAEKESKLAYILEELEPTFRDTSEGLYRVNEIIKALRVFSRNDQPGAIEEYDLNVGIENTLIVSRNEVKYVAEIQENLATIPTVSAIGGQINQVLLNLILNAAQAIKAKGFDTPGLIKISTHADSQNIFCTVADNGIGIPKEAQKDIFNPFFTTKPVGQGTGLGLSISYDIIVNKHHGEMYFSSEEGTGTTFTFKLPYGGREDKEETCGGGQTDSIC